LGFLLNGPWFEKEHEPPNYCTPYTRNEVTTMRPPVQPPKDKLPLKTTFPPAWLGPETDTLKGKCQLVSPVPPPVTERLAWVERLFPPGKVMVTLAELKFPPLAPISK
jgi:hypothetical protein